MFTISGEKKRSAAAFLSGLLLAMAAMMVVMLSTGCGGAQSGSDAVAPAAELPTVDVVRQLTPSVVHVLTLPDDSGVGAATPGAGVGTGIILQSDGYVLTNNHLIDGAGAIIITLHNGESYPARVVGGAPNPDVAVVKIDATGLRPARAGSSAGLQVGQDVIAIGHALALPGGPTVSKGVISALGRSIESGLQDTFVDLIQTDAAINPGNSGGPLVNARGEVIGINTAGLAPSRQGGGGQGINFAINIDDAMSVSEQLIRQGYVNRGFLGISPLNLTPVIANQIGVPVNEGIVIARVAEGSRASTAGLRGGDVIVAMNGRPIRNTGDLSKFLIDNPPGRRISVSLYRGGAQLETEATLSDMPAF